eukprot:CAMPEP_0114627932 /NCGR_PEP_ID=MMETSP0168-20121206/12555_1 /TAXON_ID=95228 ORGANISM="Vannella sp., Strain DIVA3 517/6/12" /NCGR_SAMPLE_ID=MMETSP0168 /ASSEMBLY_ACC=CAM_ASM_000044 /LENGTH=267 /DNA_ID=CAMNT_0001839289 /DNA_START=59 /DNA_END=858 /DNA_ORIENTATION=-
MVETFGKHSRVLNPGLACLACCIGETLVGRVSLRVQQLDVDCETKTADNVFVNVVVSVQYQVIRDSAYDAFYRLTNPKEQIRAYVFDVVRASVPKIALDDVFETKDDIAVDVKAELAKSMGEFGYQIIQTLITDIQPAANVKKAMNEINAAQRLRVAASDKAEAEKILVVKAAEADAESKYLSGVGIARQRKAIVEGLRDSVMTFAENVEGTSAQDVMDLVLVTQYFDTLKDIGASSRSSTVFVPHSPGAVASVASEVRQGFLEASA